MSSRQPRGHGRGGRGRGNSNRFGGKGKQRRKPNKQQTASSSRGQKQHRNDASSKKTATYFDDKIESADVADLLPVKTKLKSIQSSNNRKEGRRDTDLVDELDVDEEGFSMPKTLIHISLNDLLRDVTGIANNDIDEDSLRGMKNMMQRPMMNLYSFEPCKDSRVVSSAISNLHSNEQTPQASEIKNAVDKLLANDAISKDTCFESLSQTMWWYSVSVGDDITNSIELPPIAAMTTKKIVDLISNRALANAQPSAISTALALRKKAKSVESSWGYMLDRCSSNPSIPAHTDAIQFRSAMHNYATLIDYILGYSHVYYDESLNILRSFALSWEGDVPTIQEYRGFLCKLMYMKHYPALSMADALGPIVSEAHTMVNQFVDEYQFDNDDEYQVGVPALRDLMWMTHCLIYTPKRFITPAMYTGAASCRWYLAADEEVATAASDLSPILIGQPLSVSKSVGRLFIGNERVEYERLATGRKSIHDEYFHTTPCLEHGESFYNNLRDDFFGREYPDCGDGSIQADLIQSNENEADINFVGKVDGIPEVEPRAESMAFTATLPNIESGHYNDDDVASFVMYSRDAKRTQDQFDKSIALETGVESTSMLNNIDSCPSYRVYDDIHGNMSTGNVISAKKEYNALIRNRIVGEALHQWARDVSAADYWISELEFLGQVDAPKTSGIDDIVRTVCPRSPQHNTHMSWKEEIVRVNYEVYFKRVAMQDLDETALVHDIESDAAVRVSPVSDETSYVRKMMPCAMRRSYGSMPINVEEVRSQYWRMLCDVHGYMHLRGRHEPESAFRISDLTSYKIVKRLVHLFTASQVSEWIRMWCAMETVDRMDSEGLFKRYTVPVLAKKCLAPILKRDVVNRFINASILSVVDRGHAWNGDFYHSTLEDADYIWTQLPECNDLTTLVESMEERVQFARESLTRRAQEMVFSSVNNRLDNIANNLSAYNYQDDLDDDDDDDHHHYSEKVRNSMKLLLGAGVFNNHSAMSLGRRYYVDVLNSLVILNNKVEHSTENTSISLDYIPLKGWLSRVLASQFADLSLGNLGVLLSDNFVLGSRNHVDIYEILVGCSRCDSDINDRIDTNIAVRLANSIANEIGVSSMIASPIRSKLWTLDTVDYDDTDHDLLSATVVRTGVEHMVAYIIGAGRMDAFLHNRFCDNDSEFSVSRNAADIEAMDRSNMRCSLYASRACNMASFIAASLSAGDSRNDIVQYVRPNSFLPGVVEDSMAPDNLFHYVSQKHPDNSDARGVINSTWFARYDQALWHNYIPFTRRRVDSYKRIMRQAQIAKHDCKTIMQYGKDDTLELDNHLGLLYNLPAVKSVEASKKNLNLWTLAVDNLSSYFWVPYALDPRHNSRPNVLSITNMSIYSSKNSQHMDTDPLVRSRHKLDRYERDMSENSQIIIEQYILACDSKLDTTVPIYVSGRTSVSMSARIGYIASEHNSLKPYPLRCPGIDYAVVDTVSSASINGILADVYHSYSREHGFAAFVELALYSERLGMPAMPETVRISIERSSDKFPVEHRYSYRYELENPEARAAARRAPVFYLQTHQTIALK
jgi:hypothetical protein